MPQSAFQKGPLPDEWDAYVKRFNRKAFKEGHDITYVERCLQYAKQLASKNLPVIFDQYHLSKLMGIGFSYVLRCTNSATNFYREFEIAKRSGKPRRISAPLPTLQRAQTWILQEILAALKPSPFAHAFGKGCSIRANARFHLKQKTVLKIDIKDFFPSISVRSVYHLFREMGYTPSVCATLAGISTLNGSLPQGAPTSPAISNLVCRRLDSRIAGFCRENKWRFTRYADDLTFSGDLDVAALLKFARKVLREYGFKINEEKTRILRKHQRQIVTGVVVNARPRAPRALRQELRQIAYFVKQFGIVEHMARLEIRYANYHAHLVGKAQHVLFLDPTDRDAKMLLSILTPQQG